MHLFLNNGLWEFEASSVAPHRNDLTGMRCDCFGAGQRTGGRHADPFEDLLCALFQFRLLVDQLPERVLATH